MSSGSVHRSVIPTQSALRQFDAKPLVMNKARSASAVKKHLPIDSQTISATSSKSVTASKIRAKTPRAVTSQEPQKIKLARLQPAKTEIQVLTANNISTRNRLRRIARQRNQYRAAEKALILGKRIEYGLLISKLKDYPLYPYLVSKDYSARLKSLSHTKIKRFLKLHGTTIPGVRLRFSWVRLLARQQRWEKIIAVYRPTTSRQQRCLYNKALYKTNKKRQAFSSMKKIWLTHRRLPSDCNFILTRWHASGRLTTALVWARVELMLAKKRSRHILTLKKYLPSSKRHWLTTWHNIYRKPIKIADKKLLSSKRPIARRILAYGLKRLARSQPQDTALFLRRNIRKNTLNAYQTAQIHRQIGMTYAYRGKYESLQWLSKVPEKYASDKLKAWRVRVALAHKKWPKVLFWIDKLKSKDYKSFRWTYWRARALEATGKKAKAYKLFQRVAKDRSFEGFMAADRIRVPYSFQSRTLHYSKSQLLLTESKPGILRAREFFFLGNIRAARREWYYTIRKFKELDLRRAAVIAHRWHWHDRAILTLGKSSYRDDLRVRFPLKHKSMVIKRSKDLQIEPAWAMAVIRRESAFQVSARSGVGARGLMQLMPRTAHYVARKLKIKMRTAHLKRPALNIRLGVSYLKYQLDKFSGHPVLATAAYNAGPHRVTKWLKQRGPRAADIWVETIPYHETREYTRNIMAYIAIYEQRMGLKLNRLKHRLKPVSVRAIAKTGVNF